MSPVVEADLTWTGTRFESGVQVEIGTHGRIGRVGALGLTPTRRLARRALIPGMVNAHSHAFQRGLRGHGERFPAGRGSFWTWREAMYQLVESLDADQLHQLSLQAFREMRAAGTTTVGEFHYLHHQGPGRDFSFDRVMLDAAAEAGIRMVLLVTYYRTGGIGQPLGFGQRRFATESPDEYWHQVDALARELGPRQTLGAVVHSVRAADLADLAAIHAEAMKRGMVFHMHVEEQRREVEDSMAAWGRTPMAAVLDTVGDASRMTAVHCTHTTPEDRDRYLEAGGRICLCPTTEGNLGDGHPDLSGVPLDRLCLGSDSNARIDMTEEMRWLEYGQRLRHEGRGVLAESGGMLAPALLAAATSGGAAALGIDAGAIAPGQLADLVALDLDTPALAGATPDTLLEAWITGADGRTVAATCVDGRWSDEGD